MAKDISRLIEAIDRVGIDNISLLSRMTGTPTETVRYTVKKRFPALGLNVRTPLDHGNAGLERLFVTFAFHAKAEDSARTILDALSRRAFLTYYCSAPIDGRYVAFFSVPVPLAEEFRGFLDALVDEKVLADYALERLEWSRHPELKSRFYNFKSGKWKVDWGKVDNEGEAPPAPVRIEEPSSSPEIDSTDLLIMKELELNSWRNIAEIARTLGINERTARWHYKKHVSNTLETSYVSWVPDAPKEVSSALGLVYEFKGVSKASLDKLRYLFNNFPFTWFEGGRRDGYYQVHAAMPADCLADSLRYLNPRLRKIVAGWTTRTLDLSTSYWYTVPYENFDKRAGWFFEKKVALSAIVPQAQKVRTK